MCVHIYIYIYIYIYTHTYTHVSLSLSFHIYIYIYICTHIVHDPLHVHELCLQHSVPNKSGLRLLACVGLSLVCVRVSGHLWSKLCKVSCNSRLRVLSEVLF